MAISCDSKNELSFDTLDKRNLERFLFFDELEDAKKLIGKLVRPNNQFDYHLSSNQCVSWKRYDFTNHILKDPVFLELDSIGIIIEINYNRKFALVLFENGTCYSLLKNLDLIWKPT